MLRRNKQSLIPVLVALLFLCCPRLGVAFSRHTTYQTSLGHDLDGDHLPETATVRENGSVYRISIHFTSGRPQLRLAVYSGGNEAGLTFQTSDVDDDRDVDLVIKSATSFRPVAVWLNRGKAKFQRVSSWAYGGLNNYSGPVLHRRVAYQPDPTANTSADPIAHPVKGAPCFQVELVGENWLSPVPERLPSGCIIQQIPVRGPPLLTTL